MGLVSDLRRCPNVVGRLVLVTHGENGISVPPRKKSGHVWRCAMARVLGDIVLFGVAVRLALGCLEPWSIHLGEVECQMGKALQGEGWPTVLGKRVY